jgi:hypothetical protein
MMIRISIDKTEPLVGSAVAGKKAPVPFVGWLDLLRAISELVGAEGCQGDQCLDATGARLEVGKVRRGDPSPS